MSEAAVVAPSAALLVAGRDRLHTLRKQGKLDSKEILEAVSVLESVQGVTTAMLHDSKAGIEANHPFFRKHPDMQVQSRFRDLVHAWRELAFPGSAAAMVMASPDIDNLVAHSPPPKAAKTGSPEKRADPPPASVGSDHTKLTSPASSKDEAKTVTEEPESFSEKRRRDSPSRKVATSASPAKQRKLEQASPKRAASPAKKSPQQKKKAVKELHNAENSAVVEAFEALAEWEFKLAKELGDVKRRYAAVSYKKVASVLRDLDDKVTSGASVQHLKGIGTASVKKIDECLSTGKVERLEKYRQGVYE